MSRAAQRTGSVDAANAGEEETDAQRLDRELIELLNGLRVVLPGVQVLLAVLFTVRFASVFRRTTELQQDV